MITNKFINSDGAKLSVTEYVPDQPIGKVFISTGLSGTKEGKENILQDLALKLYQNNYKVIAYDYLGHGNSDGSSIDVTVEIGLVNFDSVYRNYKDNLPIYLFGWSFGAMLSLIYASQNNLPVKAMVLWSPALDFDKSFINNEKSLFGRDIIKQKYDDKDYIQIEFNNFKLGKKFLDTANRYDMRKIINNIHCPIYVIQALNEYVLDLEVNRKFKDLFTEYIELDAIHALLEKRDEAIDKTLEWILLN